MRKIFHYITMLALCASCTHTAQRKAVSFHLTADTLRQGGLEILHNIAIVDTDGKIFYTDSTEEYEPDHFDIVVPDSAHPERCYLMLMLFDPCEDRTLVLQSDGEAIRSLGIFPSDSIPLTR